MLLLAIGGGMTVVSIVLAVDGLITRTVISSMFSGVFLLTIAGSLGSSTLRAIGRSADRSAADRKAAEPKSLPGK